MFRECAVGTRARSIPTDARADFRPAPGGKSCYSVEVEFVVDARGYPETRTARVLRTNDQAFAESVMMVMPRWRFEPATVDGVPVRQITIVKQTAQVMVVAVPAGSPPPSSPPRTRSVPKC